MGPFIYSEHYLEISTTVSPTLYGLGERFSDTFALHNGTYTIFNRGMSSKTDSGAGPPTSGYYSASLARDSYHVDRDFANGNFHINYLRNSNAMDVVLSNYSESNNKITYKYKKWIVRITYYICRTKKKRRRIG